MQPTPTPDRRSIISLSAIFAFLIAVALLSLLLTPRFFLGHMRGSYHLWLIAGRAVPLIGVALLLPALIFALAATRTRRWLPALAAALMLALTALFIVAGNRWSMQLRRVWHSDEGHYYLLTDYQYLPPLNATLGAYAIHCDAHDRRCESTFLERFTSSNIYASDDDARGIYHFNTCNVEVSPTECTPIYPLPRGTEVPVMPTPTP